jgi:predicted nucleotidyltransferase
MELFGSACRDNLDPSTSDLYFRVTFEVLRPNEYAEGYFGLLEALQELLQKPIELVVPSAVKNPYFLQAIGRTRTLLYAA